MLCKLPAYIESLTFRPCSHAQKGNAFCGNHPVPGEWALEYRPPALSRACTFVDQQTIFGSIFFPPHPLLLLLPLCPIPSQGPQWPMTMYMVSNPPIPLQFPC